MANTSGKDVAAEAIGAGGTTGSWAELETAVGAVVKGGRELEDEAGGSDRGPPLEAKRGFDGTDAGPPTSGDDTGQLRGVGTELGLACAGSGAPLVPEESRMGCQGDGGNRT